LLAKIQEERGLDCTQYKPAFLQRRLAIRLRARKVDSYSAYANLLDTDPEEYTRLLDCLTINLTFFFRDQDVFQTLQEEILPSLMQERERQQVRRLRFWSAGCASGEEPYSIAMLLAELLGDRLSEWHITILGTDYDLQALAKARQGVYDKFSFHDVPYKRLQQHFMPGVPYEVHPRLRKLVRFAQHDLLSDPYPQRLDMILCRNVLIYFAREQHKRLVELFHRALLPGGYLVIGKAEILSRDMSNLFHLVDPRCHIYRRQL